MPTYALGLLVPDIADDAYVHPDAVVIGSVTIGRGSTVWPGAVLRGDYGTINVGSGTSIQDGCVVHATADAPTFIGDDCVVGHLAHLEGCRVEDRVLIGSGAILLHGVIVQSDVLVGAHALLPNGMVVPSGAMALGIPARLRPDAVSRDHIRETVELYRRNGMRYRRELRPVRSPGDLAALSEAVQTDMPQ